MIQNLDALIANQVRVYDCQEMINNVIFFYSHKLMILINISFYYVSYNIFSHNDT